MQPDFQRALDTLKSLTLCGTCTTGNCEECDRLNAKTAATIAIQHQIPKPMLHMVHNYPRHKWKLGEDGKIDLFAFSSGFCNGPVCEVCGYAACEHCNPDYDSEECVHHVYSCPSCGKIVEPWDKVCDCGQRLLRYKEETNG